MRVAFAGTTDFAVACLEALERNNIDIVLVITQPDRAAGRNRHLQPPPVKTWGIARGLEVWQPTRINCPTSAKKIRDYTPDLLVVVAYGRILKQEILAIPPLGAINVHTSLLPELRGAAPIQWALLNGLDNTGLTTMHMDEGLDTGDIILQEEVPIFPGDNRETLEKRLAAMASKILPKTISLLALGTAPRRAQPPGKWTYAPPLKNTIEEINWQDSAAKIFNLVRALAPSPGAFTNFRGRRLKILKARPMPGAGKPGFLSWRNRELLAGTGEGLLVLEVVQPEGKKQMEARSFGNGYRVLEGEQFLST